VYSGTPFPGTTHTPAGAATAGREALNAAPLRRINLSSDCPAGRPSQLRHSLEELEPDLGQGQKR